MCLPIFLFPFLAAIEPWFTNPIAWAENLPLRAVIACFTAFIIGIIFAPLIIKIIVRYQFIDSNEKCDSNAVRDQNKAKKNTPIMGGLIIFLALLFSTLLWAKWDWPVVGFLLTALGFCLIGFSDDVIKTKSKSKGLSAKFKMLLLLLVSTAIAFGIWHKFRDSAEYTTIIFIKTEWEWKLALASSIAFISWMILVFCGSTNAVNLTDGMDGLAVVCSIMIAAALALVAYLVGDSSLAKDFSLLHVPLSQELSVCSMALVGAGLAFLWFNSHPASIFMGDSGSLMLGGILAYIAIILRQEILYFILSGIFVLEAISVIIQVSIYKIKRKRIFRCAPIHHHFALGSWKAETKVTIRFWIIQFFFVLLGLSLVVISCPN